MEFLKNFAWILMPALLVFELLVVFLLNPNYHREIVDAKSGVGEASDKLRTHSLTLSGMAFTVMAILLTLSENPARFIDALRILGVSIALLFLSYELREVTQTKNIWFTLQEKTLGYGFLSLFVCVVILYDVAITNTAAWAVLFGFVLVGAVRFFTVWRQLSMLRSMANQNDGETSDQS